jgi:acetoin utilization protein AcuB
MGAVPVKDVMTHVPIAVAADARVRDIRAKLERYGFHHLLVVENGKLVGVLSDRDVIRATSTFLGSDAERPQDAQTLERRAHQIMTRKPLTACASDEVRDAAARMLEAGVSCLPVVDADGAPVGIVTLRDVVRHFLTRDGAGR